MDAMCPAIIGTEAFFGRDSTLLKLTTSSGHTSYGSARSISASIVGLLPTDTESFLSNGL